MENGLAINELRRLLAYDAETGRITWRVPSNRRKIGDEAGCFDKHGYRRVTVGGKGYGGHVIAWALHHGKWPEKFMDHINGVRDDNRICNLRLATPTENAYNRKMFSTNTSGRRGVTWNACCNKWQAGIKKDGKNHYLGLFTDIEEAAEAYRVAARVHFGEFAR